MTDAQPPLETAMDALRRAIRELNEERDPEEQISLDPTTILYGEGGPLDSIDLVRLVVLFEREVMDATQSPISISDDRAMSDDNSHFQTIERLAAHVAELIAEERRGS